MNIKRIIFISTLISTLLSAQEASKYYASIESGFANIAFVKNHFFASRGERNYERKSNLNTDFDIANGNSFAVTFGTNFPLTFAGANSMKIYTKVWHMAAKASSSSNFKDNGPNEQYGWIMLDNSKGVGTITTNNVLKTNIEQDLKYWGADILFSLEYTLGEDAYFSIFAGPSYRSNHKDTNIKGNFMGDSPTVNLKEKISENLFGAKLGINYNLKFKKKWLLNMDFAISQYRKFATYKGAYTHYFAPNYTNINRKLSDTQSSSGVDLGIQVGYKLTKQTYISIYANYNYLSNVTQVSYGSSLQTDPTASVLSLVNDKQFSSVHGLKLNYMF